MDDVAEKLATRDRFLRKISARRNVDQLMQELWNMQQASWDRLQRIPEAWDLYRRQQFKQRAIDVRPDYFE